MHISWEIPAVVTLLLIITSLDLIGSNIRGINAHKSNIMQYPSHQTGSNTKTYGSLLHLQNTMTCPLL